MRRSLKIFTSALALTTTVGLIAACGSDSNDSSSSSSTAAASTEADTTAAPAPEQAPAPKVGTPGSAGIPAIKGGGTDTETEATIEAGTGTPSADLLIADIKVGTGEVAALSDSVDVRYTGALYTDGTVFDSSWKNGKDPVNFPLSGVVPGFAKGIEGMKVGGRREIVIPPNLGYGAQANGPIPASSTLVFVVDLVKLTKG
ncbi:FKBP-type peptidyl-prolyl cis-trans isomerase [Williamsia sp. CHRR-6]|uniref:FKBP-type peptidyl-prolyl cis-trans isomerase n=1 Tax=Williamsia sp. CHRR-6 TaxID=2835871 RepID=UPI001BDA8647|nr:FKBP-type peptidyl-prolyl cis-trans isomerase [Williamsia sp. CHRR-6]MBT0566113.1 FKBP-type peptidyl-prolyl cis-trans isomerase [Williamsia sp. CHRR-6]